MKRLIFTLLILIPAFMIKAQEAQGTQYQDETEAKVMQTALEKQADPESSATRVTWVSNRPRDNWFISISGGIADLMSEESRYIKFTDRIKPTFGLSFGKWMSPVWGVRMNITGAELQGFTTWKDGFGLGDWYVGKNYSNAGNGHPTNNYVHAYTLPGAELVKKRFLNTDELIESKKNGSGYYYDMTYAAASIDFMLNLKNLTMKYNPKGFFNPVLYAGLGFAHTFKDKDKERTAVNSIMEKAGLMFNFRLDDRWDIFLDGQALFVPEFFDRKVGDGNTQDIVANYSIGFTYRINYRHFIRAPFRDPNEIAALNAEINELRKRPVACPPPVICPECPKCPECPPVVVDVMKTPVTKQDLTFLPTPVFFRINSSVIDEGQWNSIQKAAEYLQENPSKRIKVTGYADKQTGTPAINKRLSEQRSKAVYNALVKKYNIAPSRIETSFLGDTFQPFTENDWNRVVIFVIPN